MTGFATNPDPPLCARDIVDESTTCSVAPVETTRPTADPIPTFRLSLTELVQAHANGVSIGVLADLTGRTHQWTEQQLAQCRRRHPRAGESPVPTGRPVRHGLDSPSPR